MGVFDKIKTIFTEEVEEEKPIRKEVIQVEIPSPTVALEKEVNNEQQLQKKEEKKEEKFVFPVFFDDSEFENLEKTKEIKVPKYNSVDNYKKSKVQEKEEQKPKVFKPTPIISPVYGVLDKNYHKEDIKTKKEVEVKPNEIKENVSIDDIRKKAFGTLEDVLENTLFGKIIFDDVDLDKEKKKDEKDMFFELEELESRVALNRAKNPDYDKEDNDVMSDSDENYDKDYLYDDEMDEKYDNQELDRKFENNPKIESDLFNLIDSMYEKGDE